MKSKIKGIDDEAYKLVEIYLMQEKTKKEIAAETGIAYYRVVNLINGAWRHIQYHRGAVEADPKTPDWVHNIYAHWDEGRKQSFERRLSRGVQRAVDDCMEALKRSQRQEDHKDAMDWVMRAKGELSIIIQDYEELFVAKASLGSHAHLGYKHARDSREIAGKKPG